MPRRPDHPRVKGVLAPYAQGFERELSRLGYSPFTASEHLYLMADLSRWLDGRGLGLAELSAARAEKFLCERRSKGHKRYVTPRAMEALSGYLRGLGLVPGRTAPAPQGPVGRLLGELVEYLVSERALAPGTIEGYRHYAQWFLSEYAPGLTTDGCGLDRLEVEQVTRFVLVDCCKLSVGATKNAVTALRVLMRFLFLEGYTPTCLVEAVPRAIPWRDSGRSRALAAEQVSRLLTSCDRRSSAGRRDFALLTLMARLGLRRGEVAALSLDDLDWRNGEVVVTGKGGRRDRLPLPCDVGEAIAGYCRHGRPRNGHRNLFLQVQAPYGPLTPGAVTLIVGAACRRAGVASVGAHALRHSAATAMRRAGAPLFEVGQVLRHRLLATSALYAKDDLDALATIARPWPGARS
jgi:integrase/recombinase XerD